MNLKLSLSLPLLLLSLTLPARSEVIYQAFDDPYAELETQLPRLQSLGYSLIQISPPQKSHPADAWWANYQPIDLTQLENRLGDEQDLVNLITRAHELNLKIIVDTVLNHMANVSPYIDTLDYPQFSAIHFHPQQCIDYSDRAQVVVGWVGCDLPDLRTRSPYVREQAKAFLQKLLDLGADGFRFDSAKHIEPEFFAEIMTVIPPDRFVYGEVIGETLEESQAYTPYFPVTDYHLYGTLVEALAPAGNLQTLIDPEDQRRALLPEHSVRFARNHDIVANEDFYRFADPEDTHLANAYLLATGLGHPFIFKDDATHAITQAGVQFYWQMQDHPLSYPSPQSLAPEIDPQQLLLIQRGNQGLMILYTGATPIQIRDLSSLELSPGSYLELISQTDWAWPAKDSLPLALQPDSVWFLVKKDE